MVYKSFLKMLMPSPVKNYLNDLQERIGKLEIAVRNLQAGVGNLQRTAANLETTVDCLIESPQYIGSDDIGFNGQVARKEIFNELIATMGFQYVFETGTWTGNTTGYMAETSKLPVFSTDLNRRFQVIAKMRLSKIDTVELENLDSRQFIRKMASNSKLINSRSFFYLDAHWYNDLPLSEEIGLIAQHWSDFVIMIDDFKVPGDEGYGYDDYGRSKALTLEYIQPSLKQYNLVPFFPSKPSYQETGNKRGCVVLARQGTLANTLKKVASLKEYVGA